MKGLGLIGCWLLAVCACLPAWSQAIVHHDYTITFTSISNDDTFISEKQPGSNFGSKQYLYIGVKNNGKCWALLTFAIPQFKEKVYVTKAYLYLYPIIVNAPAAYNVHLVTQRFIPAPRFQGKENQRLGVTWETMPVFDAVPCGSVYIDRPEQIATIDIRSCLQRAFDEKKDFCALLLRNGKDFARALDSYVVCYSANNTHPSYKGKVPFLDISLLQIK